MLLGVVIVAYKNNNLTCQFVQQQLPKIDVPFCAIVINNAASAEESAALADACGIPLWSEKEQYTDASSPRIFLWGTPENLGYARGNNQGVRLLKSRFPVTEWLFSNTDIELQSDHVLSTLIAKMHACPDCGCIGPKVVGFSNMDQSPYYDRPSILRQIAWRLAPFLRNTKQVFPLPSPQEGPCYWVIGAFVLLDAQAFERCGGFDERTFLFNEEPILSERLAAIGSHCFFTPAVSVLHYERASTNGTDIDKRRRQIEFDSLLIYYRYYRHASILSIWLLRFAEFCYRAFLWRTLRHG